MRVVQAEAVGPLGFLNRNLVVVEVVNGRARAVAVGSLRRDLSPNALTSSPDKRPLGRVTRVAASRWDVHPIYWICVDVLAVFGVGCAQRKFPVHGICRLCRKDV